MKWRVFAIRLNSPFFIFSRSGRRPPRERETTVIRTGNTTVRAGSVRSTYPTNRQKRPQQSNSSTKHALMLRNFDSWAHVYIALPSRASARATESERTSQSLRYRGAVPQPYHAMLHEKEEGRAGRVGYEAHSQQQKCALVAATSGSNVGPNETSRTQT